MSTRILPGDCRDVLKTLAADSLHACLTDPPYGLGFMGKEWDSGSVAFDPVTWRAVYRVLKPGAYLMAFGGTRTYHRLACAIEDAGFEIRDQFGWAYGSGFPKSHDASKAIDKAAGAVREVVGSKGGRYSTPKQDFRGGAFHHGSDTSVTSLFNDITAPATPEAAAWAGWGTAVKPAWEPIVLARKPMIGNLAKNLLTHGCGALNIDACRIQTEEILSGSRNPSANTGIIFGVDKGGTYTPNAGGRWPANLAHDGSDEVLAAFAAYGERGAAAPVSGAEPSSASVGRVTGKRAHVPGVFHGDTGSAARFFYSAKADKADRADSKHPTVKPVDLIQHYLRLIVPPGGTVIDCFAGSGTTGEAAMLEGFDCILIERDPQSVADIRHRIKRWSGADMPLFAEATCPA